MLAARATTGLAIAALVALVAVHLLKRELDPSRTMISRYALGPHGWLMTLAFGAWAAASLFAVVALAPVASSLAGRIGLLLLLIAGAGLAFATFPMDPVGTPRDQATRSGKLHGFAFLIGVPCMVIAPAILSLALRREATHADVPLLPVTGAIWFGLVLMIAAMVKVGPDHGPDPDVPRLLGWANRLLMVADAVWMIVAAWPLAR